MFLKYPIILEKEVVGTAQLTRQGMYYRIQCLVSGTVPVPCRIILNTTQGDIDLGICVKEETGFGMIARVRQSVIGKRDPIFQIRSGKAREAESFYPVEENMPFRHLTELKNARFTIKDGKTGIQLPSVTVQSQDLQGNDRNPAHQNR